MKLSPVIRAHGRNRVCIGFLLSAGPKSYRAYDQDGRPIGLFDSEELAARAVYDRKAIGDETRN